ncbi:MAG: hypothetical protein H7X71_01820, partial [Chitinophagales bacterium]|nr:hypothetical protein [Chitinophagales bacterium]
SSTQNLTSLEQILKEVSVTAENIDKIDSGENSGYYIELTAPSAKELDNDILTVAEKFNVVRVLGKYEAGNKVIDV